MSNLPPLSSVGLLDPPEPLEWATFSQLRQWRADLAAFPDFQGKAEMVAKADDEMIRRGDAVVAKHGLAEIFKYSKDQPRHGKGTREGGRFKDKDDIREDYPPTIVSSAVKGISKSKRASQAEALILRMLHLDHAMANEMNTMATSVVHKMPDGSWTPERISLHQQMRDRLFADEDRYRPAPGVKPRMLMLAGRPGAGKSGFGKALKIYDAKDYFVLNSDDIKEMLPEYDPEKPWIVHREASDFMDSIGIIARAKGLNIVYDMTMNKDPKELVEHFFKHGYDVEMHLMDVSEATSRERAAYRWANDGGPGKFGRLVPPSVLDGMDTITEMFERTKQMVNDWTHWSHEELGNPVKVAAEGKYREAEKRRAMKSIFGDSLKFGKD